MRGHVRHWHGRSLRSLSTQGDLLPSRRTVVLAAPLLITDLIYWNSKVEHLWEQRLREVGVELGVMVVMMVMKTGREGVIYRDYYHKATFFPLKS